MCYQWASQCRVIAPILPLKLHSLAALTGKGGNVWDISWYVTLFSLASSFLCLFPENCYGCLDCASRSPQLSELLKYLCAIDHLYCSTYLASLICCSYANDLLIYAQYKTLIETLKQHWNNFGMWPLFYKDNGQKVIIINIQMDIKAY